MMLRGDAARPWFRRRERPNRRLGVSGGQPDGHKQGQDRPSPLSSGGSFGYECGLRLDHWEMSERGYMHRLLGNYSRNPLCVLVVETPISYDGGKGVSE